MKSHGLSLPERLLLLQTTPGHATPEMITKLREQGFSIAAAYLRVAT